MAATAPLTFGEFIQLPEPVTDRIELLRGELVTMRRGDVPHEIVKKNLNRILIVWLAQNQIADVFVESMYQLGEYSALIPDVSILFPGRIVPGSMGWLQEAPELAIEVVSFETAALMEEKIATYFAHGAKSVWIVFPEQRSMRIYDASGRFRRFKENQMLDDPVVLPGFSAPVSSFFERL